MYCNGKSLINIIPYVSCTFYGLNGDKFYVSQAIVLKFDSVSDSMSFVPCLYLLLLLIV